MKASIVVLSWNGEQYLPGCLSAVLAQAYPDYEVVVVDNASTDGSAALVAERFPRVRLLRNAANLGFGGGMNVGLRATQGEVVALLNQDTEVAPDWLPSLVECLAADERIAIAGCKVLYPDRRTLQHAGGVLAYPLALADHYGYRQVDRGQYDEEREVDYVTGAALALRRRVLDQIGLFDEGFFPAYYEETDLCRRARRAGYRVVYTPRARVVHYESTSVVRESYAYFCAYHASRLRFVLKHYSGEQFLEDFVPAERAWLASRTLREEGRALQEAYSRARAHLPETRAAGRQPGDRPDSPLEERRMAEALETLEKAAGDLIQPPPYDPLAVYMGQIQASHEVKEFRFASPTPVVGPLLALLRSAWNSVSTKWYVRAILQQQNAFNRASYQALQEICSRLGETQVGLRQAQTRIGQLESSVEETEYSTAENDRQTVALATELARLRVWVQGLEEEVASLRGLLEESQGKGGR